MNKIDGKIVSLGQLMRLDIRGFQHCQTRNIYLCLKLPKQCPTCRRSMYDEETQFKIPPFMLPKPHLSFTCVNLPPFCLVLQFTSQNLDTGNMHIGVTNSKSDIYDFNANGMNKNSPRWSDAPLITIRLENDKNKAYSLLTSQPVKHELWDFYLDDYWEKSKSARWNSSTYNETSLNCLDFVVDFMLDYGCFSKTYLLYALNEINMTMMKQNETISSEDTSHNPTSIISASQLMRDKLARLKEMLKKKLLDQIIEPEYSKFLKYINLIFELNEKEYLIEELN